MVSRSVKWEHWVMDRLMWKLHNSLHVPKKAVGDNSFPKRDSMRKKETVWFYINCFMQVPVEIKRVEESVKCWIFDNRLLHDIFFILKFGGELRLVMWKSCLIGHNLSSSLKKVEALAEGRHRRINKERHLIWIFQVGKRDREEFPKSKSPSKVVGTTTNREGPVANIREQAKESANTLFLSPEGNPSKFPI